MDYNKFYERLFRPIEERVGALDAATIMAIIGFDCGGPVSLKTVGWGRRQFVTYVTCELAVCDKQQPAAFGRYEVMMDCDDKSWAHDILTRIARMSFEKPFEHGHTVDISQIVGRKPSVRGLVVEEFARVKIDRKGYGLLRFHGVTGLELKLAIDNGADTLFERLKRSGMYPNTSIHRIESVV